MIYQFPNRTITGKLIDMAIFIGHTAISAGSFSFAQQIEATIKRQEYVLMQLNLFHEILDQEYIKAEFLLCGKEKETLSMEIQNMQNALRISRERFLDKLLGDDEEQPDEVTYERRWWNPISWWS